MSDRLEGRTEPGRETRLPFASEKYRAPTPSEIRTVMQALGLTGSQAAALLGLDHARTVRKWIGGESPMPYSAWRLLLIHAELALEESAASHDAQRDLREELHRDLDRALDRCGPAPQVSVEYGTVSVPDEPAGMMRTKHTGAITIRITK